MDFRSKRRRSFAVIFLNMFIGGVEYAVVYPTLWEYLLRLGVPAADVYYLGVCVASLTLTDMVAGLFFGRLLDKSSRVAAPFLFFNLFQILSSLIYLLASSPPWIVASRLVGGIGNVICVALLTDVCRATTAKERTPILVGFNIAQQLGLLFGPACNLFLREVDFTVSLAGRTVVVDKLNAPGLFMFALYLGLEAAVALFYYDLEKAKKVEEAANATPPPQPIDVSDHSNDTAQEAQPATSSTREEEGSPTPAAPPTWSEYYDELLRGEIVALTFLRMIGLLSQTCFETIVTPMMRDFFGYGDFENSLLYLAGGAELVVVSLGIAWLSRRVEDRRFAAAGVAFHLATLALFLALVPGYRPGDRSNLASFAVLVAMDLASISIILDISLSLLTKLVRDEIQGFATGVRRFFVNLALLLGPLWGGAALPWKAVLFSVPLGLLIIGTVLFILSYSEMKPPAPAEPEPQDDRGSEADSGEEAVAINRSNDERTPLLGSPVSA